MASCRDCRDTVSETTAVRRSLKDKAIEHLGGGCWRCGYNRCQRNMTFHHLDPKTKDPRLTRKGKKKNGSVVTQSISVIALSRKWEVLKVEIEKCALLCKNCHGEVEAGLWDIKDTINGTREQTNT